jgi:hypothetical protein
MYPLRIPTIPPKQKTLKKFDLSVLSVEELTEILPQSIKKDMISYRQFISQNKEGEWVVKYAFGQTMSGYFETANPKKRVAIEDMIHELYNASFLK